MHIAIVGRTHRETMNYAENFLRMVPKREIKKIIRKPHFIIELNNGTTIEAIPGYADNFRGKRFDQCYVQVGLDIDSFRAVEYTTIVSAEKEKIVFW